MPSEKVLKGEVSGAFLLGLLASLHNVKSLPQSDIRLRADEIEPLVWYPYSMLISTLEQLASTVPSSNILFFAGINFLRIWYEQGPGKTMIQSGLDWLHANDESGGYNSVVRGGAPEEIGWCRLTSIDVEQGLAIYDNVVALPPDYVRGVFYGGCILFDDMEYVDVHVDDAPFPQNPMLRRLTITVRFRCKSPEQAARVDAAIDVLKPGTLLALSVEDTESLAWRFKGLRLKERYLTAYHEDARNVLAEATHQLEHTASELRAAKERIEAAAAVGIIGLWEWDAQESHLSWDSVMYHLYGLSSRAFNVTYDGWTRILHPEDRVRVDAELSVAMTRGTVFSSEFRIFWPDRSVHYIKSVAKVMSAGGTATRMLGVSYDITEQKRIQHELDQLAFYDRLTGLPNRRLLEDRLDQLLAFAQRQHQNIGLLFVDLDRFKPVNDQYGHHVGDWLLQSVASRMQGCVRGSDTVARIGGDEFVVLLPAIGNLDEAFGVAEKIRGCLEAPFSRAGDVRLEISASIGVALYPQHAQTARELMHFADNAMYMAKNVGRNAVAVVKDKE
ncbi:sensor domain-containing diguanylate cyclase [Noviherbaspirillum denitrificans]|nr:sensor domain-containing diguanylate cyclase [Noviherbaspirillum denitrificans]